MKEQIIELLTELISIDSSNTFLVENGAGSKDVLAFIKSYFDDLGVESEYQKVDDTHSNLKVTIDGYGEWSSEDNNTMDGDAITLYAHVDTVGYDLWPDRALKAEVKDDRIIGLGSCDDKGHCAAMMLLAKKLINGNIKLKGDLHLCFIDDEEGQSCGSFEYVEKNSPEACLVLESAPINTINICHQGFGWLKIIVGGKTGHGSSGAVSNDAIARLAEIIVRMERNKNQNFAKNPHELNGETVYHTGYIKGGTDFASYPDKAELGIEIGTQPGETMDDRVKEIEDIFDEVREIYPDLDAKVEVVIARKPFNTKDSEKLYEVTEKAIKQITGLDAEGVGENGWGDAQIFQDAGFPTLGIGAEGGNLHAPEEWLSISSMEQLINILDVIVKGYCGQVSDE